MQQTETTNAHSLFFPPLPVCLLCSALPPPLLSVCVSLQQKHTLCSLWGDGRSLNTEPNQTGGRRRGKKTSSSRENTQGQFESVQTVRWGDEASTLCVSFCTDKTKQTFMTHTHTQGVCTAALCRGGLGMKKVRVRRS